MAEFRVSVHKAKDSYGETKDVIKAEETGESRKMGCAHIGM